MVRPFVPVLFALTVSLPAVARAGTVYFVMAERPEVAALHDSYVLPLSAAADVAHARDLIARGADSAGAPIVFAAISPGSDGINRDVRAAGQPLWNWHVARFEGFGDVGIELTDGNPTQVGDDVSGWILNTRRGEGDATGHIRLLELHRRRRTPRDAGSPSAAGSADGGDRAPRRPGRTVVAGRAVAGRVRPARAIISA